MGKLKFFYCLIKSFMSTKLLVLLTVVAVVDDRLLILDRD